MIPRSRNASSCPRRHASTLRAAASVIVCLLCAPCGSAAAQAEPGKASAEAAKQTEEYSATASAGVFVLGSALSIYAHETGHWFFAYVAGAKHARISLFPPRTYSQFSPGATSLQGSVSVLAGPLTTRFLAEGIDHYLNAASPSRAARLIGGATYLAMRFDLPWQVLASTAEHFANDTARSHDDLAQGFVNLYFATRRSRTVVYAALVAAETLDMWLDAGEIADNFARLRGRARRRHDTRTSGLHPAFDASSGSFGLEFRHRF